MCGDELIVWNYLKSRLNTNKNPLTFLITFTSFILFNVAKIIFLETKIYVLVKKQTNIVLLFDIT